MPKSTRPKGRFLFTDSDRYQAMQFLRGNIITDDKGRRRTRYLKSSEEPAAREALSRVLFSLSKELKDDRRFIVQALANLACPDTDNDELSNGRELVLKRRRNHRPRDMWSNSQIVYEVESRLQDINDREQLSKAITETADMFEMDVAAVRRVWRNYKRVYPPKT